MSKKWLLAFGLIWAGVAFSDGVPTACQPVMRPDRQWWALARHAEIIKRLAQAKTNAYDLVLVGDSITHRWERKECGAAVYPKLLSRYGVLNLGCGGDQTQHVLWRLEHGALGSDYPYTAKVFAVMIGVNNGGKDPEGTVAGVKKIVGEIRAKHPESKVLLMAILPHGKNPRNAVSAKVINPALKAYAAQSGCTWLDMNEKFLDEKGEIKPGLMMPDDLHPIAAGYEIWLSEMCPVVDELLGRRLSVEQNASVSNCNDACERLRMVAGEKGYEVTELIVTGGCVRISYVLHPTAESFIRCQLALPLDRPWNGRFWGMGNGGGAGSVNVDLAFAAKGNAVAHTDMGTSRGVFGKREVVRDFGWRATHLMTVSGKDLTSAFFGRPPRYSYFSGGSTGGGQGFHEALRFPDDYDGILSYVPANTRLPLHVYFAWNMRLMKYPDGRDVFSKEELAAVEQAAIDWFADKDAPSARGKYLTDTGYSPVTEKAVLELAAKRVPSLCEGDKLNRLHRMFTGPVLGGRTVHAGVPFSASLRNAAGNQWMLRWYLGPDRDLESVTDEELVQWMKSWGPDCDACGDGYAKFAGRGGKMIVVGGLEDSVVPTPSMVEWYGRAARECGGVEHLLKSCRLFLLPGRAHGQGRGCGNVQNDIGILVDWVESGVAPEEVASPLRCGGVLSVKHFVPADICQK